MAADAARRLGKIQTALRIALRERCSRAEEKA
jgi:hypothetical protein